MKHINYECLMPFSCVLRSSTLDGSAAAQLTSVFAFTDFGIAINLSRKES